MIDLNVPEQIYDVPLGNASGNDVMERLETVFVAQANLLIADDPVPTATSVLCRGGYDESAEQTYADHFVTIDVARRANTRRQVDADLGLIATIGKGAGLGDGV